jgi:hypothetical protein
MSPSPPAWVERAGWRDTAPSHEAPIATSPSHLFDLFDDGVFDDCAEAPRKSEELVLPAKDPSRATTPSATSALL